MTSESTIVGVLVLNVKRAGWNSDTCSHNHEPLIRAVAQAPGLAHLVISSECTYYTNTISHDRPLWTVVNRLSELLPGADHYRPFITDRPGHKNHPGLFVSAEMVEPVEWMIPGPHTRQVMEYVLECRIAGHRAFVKPVHRDGGGGPFWMAIQSTRDGELASKPSLVAGDVNCPSCAEPLPTVREWARRNAETPWKQLQKARRRRRLWAPRPTPYDDFLAAGYWDAAQIARDTTSTIVETDSAAGMVVDRAAMSHLLPARLVNGSYRVFTPSGEWPSDHKAVYFQLEFAADHAGCYKAAARPRLGVPIALERIIRWALDGVQRLRRPR